MGQYNAPTDRGKWLTEVIGQALIALYFVAIAVWAIMTGK
jgi:hypothetical protein